MWTQSSSNGRERRERTLAKFRLTLDWCALQSEDEQKVNRFIIIIAGCLALALSGCQSADPTSTLIHNAVVIDGSGSPPYVGAVRIDGDRIVDAGILKPLRNETTIDAQGKVLAPGFIDTHSHHDRKIADNLDMLAAVSQGITTIVRGADGGAGLEEAYGYISQKDFNDLFHANPAAINIASFSPHNGLRHVVMGSDFRRPASDEEISAMQAIVEDDMNHGALGLGTGLEYMPGIFSETEEVIELARIAASHGGHYMSHVRDEDANFLDAVDEVIRIGRETGIPVHISHIKLADRKYWSTVDTVLDKLDSARDEGVVVSADIYPYIHWQSLLAIFFPERDYTSMAEAEYTFERTTAPDTLVITRFEPNPSYAGLTVAEIARLNEQSPEETLLLLTQMSDRHLQETGRTGDSIIAKGMTEADVTRFMKWEYTNLCTDGGHSGGHPRGYGSFPRFLNRYVNDETGITPEAAVRKMSGLSAINVGIENRGLIEPGYFADLVLYDPDTIEDHATFDEPEKISTGILSVWVNGQVVFQEGETTGVYPGRIVNRAGFDGATKL